MSEDMKTACDIWFSHAQDFFEGDEDIGGEEEE